MNYRAVLNKFVKGAIFGAGSALFSIDLSVYSLHSVDDFKKFGLVGLIALVAGALHGIWEIGKQYFLSDEKI